MSAMSAMFVNLIPLVDIKGPVTNATGGTSLGNPDAGSKSVANPEAFIPPTGSEKTGAGIVTAIVLVTWTGMFGWMSLGD